MNEQKDVRSNHIYIPALIIALLITIMMGCEGNPVYVEYEGPQPDDLKVLFIGNSLSAWFDMIPQFEALADSAGRSVWIGNSVRLGTTLQEHIDHGEVFGLIESEDWDYIVLQGSHYAIAFPDSHHHVISPYRTFRDFIRNINPDCGIVVYMDYSLPLVNQWGTYSFFEFSQMLREGTKVLADSLGFIIAPVGWAFRSAMIEKPDFVLYDSRDHVHPSEEAQYLHACVYYATLFQESPAGNPFTGTLSEGLAALLQRIARDVVLVERDAWNLP